MMQRDFDPDLLEWMDRPQPVSEELKKDLANLVTLNRMFGSYSMVIRVLSRWLQPNGSYRLLDLATGSADIPRKLVQWARQIGIDLRIDAVDLMEPTLSIAREWSGGYPEIQLLQGDAREFQGEKTYDGVLCSLALHHFSEKDAVSVLRNMRANSHGWMFAGDLERSRWGQVCIWLLTTFWMRERMTRDDARISMRRAFSYEEFGRLASNAGWGRFEQRRFPVTRQAVWSSK